MSPREMSPAARYHLAQARAAVERARDAAKTATATICTHGPGCRECGQHESNEETP